MDLPPAIPRTPIAHRLSFPSGAAIVAGGSGALGSAVCRALGEAGCPIVVGYRDNAAAAQTLAADLRAIGAMATATPIDLLQADGMAGALTAAEQLAGGVAAAIYCAGTRKQFDFISRVSDADWESALTMDVRGFLALARTTLPALRRSAGSIAAVTTYQGARLEPRGSLSSVPKAAVERAVMAIAREEGRFGVRANAVRAGWIDAGSAAAILDSKMREQKRKQIPLGRVGTPGELAAVIRFLVSSEASFVTGAAIQVDGGEAL